MIFYNNLYEIDTRGKTSYIYNWIHSTDIQSLSAKRVINIYLRKICAIRHFNLKSLTSWIGKYCNW